MEIESHELFLCLSVPNNTNIKSLYEEIIEIEPDYFPVNISKVIKNDKIPNLDNLIFYINTNYGFINIFEDDAHRLISPLFSFFVNGKFNIVLLDEIFHFRLQKIIYKYYCKWKEKKNTLIKLKKKLKIKIE